MENTITDVKEREVKTVAATYAMVKGESDDSAAKNYFEYQSAKQVATLALEEEEEERTPSVIPGLENSVVNLDDVEEAQKYLEQDKQLSEANQQLIEQQKQVEERTADI